MMKKESLSLPSSGRLCVADPLSARRANKRDAERKNWDSSFKKQRDAEQKKRQGVEIKNRVLAGLDHICHATGSPLHQKHVDDQLLSVCRDVRLFLDSSAPQPSPPSKANDWKPTCAHLVSTSTSSPSWQSPSPGSQDALSRALEVLRNKTNDPAAQAQSCEVLWYLAEEAQTCRLIVDAGGHDAIARAMKLHWTSLRVQECGCDAIRRLASNGGPIVQKSIVAAGCINAIVAGMTVHSGKVGLQEAGCGALESILYRVAENKAPFAKAQGIQAVIAAMVRHPNVMKVQWAACDTLAALIAEDQADESDILWKVIEANGIEALVAAWQRYPIDLHLVVAITNMLRRLQSVSSDAALRVQLSLRRNRIRTGCMNMELSNA